MCICGDAECPSCGSLQGTRSDAAADGGWTPSAVAGRLETAIAWLVPQHGEELAGAVAIDEILKVGQELAIRLKSALAVLDSAQRELDQRDRDLAVAHDRIRRLGDLAARWRAESEGLLAILRQSCAASGHAPCCAASPRCCRCGDQRHPN